MGMRGSMTPISTVASQPLNRILWQTPVDLNPQYTGDELFIHYGSPLRSRRSNTVLLPVKTGAAGGFEIESLAGATGATNWTLATDYVLPPHNWTPSFSGTLTPKNRFYFLGGRRDGLLNCDSAGRAQASPPWGRSHFLDSTNTRPVPMRIWPVFLSARR